MAKRYVLGSGAARKLRTLLSGSGKTDSVPRAGSELAIDNDYLPPYTVQWAQSANDGEGSWIIWLPSEELLVVDGQPVDVRDTLDAVGGDYPEGWYLLDCLATDDDAMLYMSIDMSALDRYVVWSSDAGGLDEDGIDILVAETYVDSETGVKRVKQLVYSVVTIGGQPAAQQDTYGCDERSVSLIAGSDGEAVERGHHFFLRGFGKFTVPGRASPYGEYDSPSVLELNDQESSVAVLVRVGNSASPDSNLLGYRYLKVTGGGGSAKPACFDLVLEESVSHAVLATTHKLVRCYYNVGGVTHQHADINVDALVLTAAADSVLAFAREGYNGSWGARLFANLAALVAFQGDAANYAVPLYVMSGTNAEVKADLRNAPQIQMVEVLT
jgi:hypothetical protein